MERTQSFTKIVKEEVCQNTYASKERLMSLLSAYIRVNGSVIFRKDNTILLLKTENAKIAKFIYQSLNDLFNANAHLEYLQKGNTKKTIYSVMVNDKAEEVIEKLQINFLEGKIAKDMVKDDDSIAGYLAGAFLASGSVNSPHNSNYHLEITSDSQNYAKWLSKLFGKYKNSNIEPKVIKRREKYVIYFKKSDQIADFLIMIGAVSSCMEFENVRVDRDFTNSAVRLANSDMANMKKTIEAGQRQVKDIKLIDKYLGIDNISKIKERELCKLRLEYESASLDELATLLGEKLNKNITKSNINHLFRAIHLLAGKYDSQH